MRHWASTIPNAQFLEVCVESEAVALHFHRTFGFGENNHKYSSKASDAVEDDGGFPPVINGWIPSRHYMPVGYGQLGCSGFIISDANGKFVSRQTASFLQFGEDAFRHVESILTDLLIETANENQKNRQGEAPSAGSIERIPPQVSPTRQSDRKKQKKSVIDGDSRSTSTGSPTTVLAPASVGVESMDEEHQICTDSFNRALKDPTFETLLEVFELLKSHFAHEEELIEKYAITPEQAASPFSALVTHRKDHFRILSIAAVELQRVTNRHNAGAGGCDVVGGKKV